MRLIEKLRRMMVRDAEFIAKKDNDYGSSWKKRGGVGAYMMLARKWDRIEKQAAVHDYDIFKALQNDDVGLIDDLIDLSGYLYLVRSEEAFFEEEVGAEPTANGYVNQDGPYKCPHPPTHRYKHANGNESCDICGALVKEYTSDLFAKMAEDFALEETMIDHYGIVLRPWAKLSDCRMLKKELVIYHRHMQEGKAPPKNYILKNICTRNMVVESYKVPNSTLRIRMPDETKGETTPEAIYEPKCCDGE